MDNNQNQQGGLVIEPLTGGGPPNNQQKPQAPQQSVSDSPAPQQPVASAQPVAQPQQAPVANPQAPAQNIPQQPAGDPRLQNAFNVAPNMPAQPAAQQSAPVQNNPQPVQPVQPQTPGMIPPQGPTASPPAMPPGNAQPMGGIKKPPIKKLLFVLGGLFVVILILAVVALLRGRDSRPELGELEGEVTWWGLEEPAIYEPLISTYESNHPGAQINYVQQPKEKYRERLQNAYNRGDGPDIFEYHNTWVPMFTDVLDVIPEETMSQQEFTDAFYPVVVSDLTTNEGTLGFPLRYDGLVMYVNDSILAQAGKSVPTTWDDVREIGQLLTIVDENGIIVQSGASIGNTSNVDYWQDVLSIMMLQNGVNMSSPEGELAEDALAYYLLFDKVDKAWDSSLPPSTVAFANGDVGVAFGPLSSYSEIKAVNSSLGFSVHPLPQARKDDDDPDVGFASYPVQGVWRQSERRGLSWDFLRFMSQTGSISEISNNAKDFYGLSFAYPRKDMFDLQKDSSIISSLIRLAPTADSWYMVGSTGDSEGGINVELSNVYITEIDSIGGTKTEEAIENIRSATSSVLSDFGLGGRRILGN